MREIKHRVYGKKANANLYHVTKFSLFSSFTVHDFNKIVSCFTPVLSISIVLTCFYLLIFYFGKLST